MTARYGNTRVSKIKAAINELQAAIRVGDFERAEAALDRLMPWINFLFSNPLRPIRELANKWKGHVGRDDCGHQLAQLGEELESENA